MPTTQVLSPRWQISRRSFSSKVSATRPPSKHSRGRIGRNLDAEGVSVVPLGGASGLSGFLSDLPGPYEYSLAGLCDEGEVGDFLRGLERAGLGSNLTRSDMESLGFYVCVADLEDELIRALGADSVERVIEG